jgi:transposase
VGQNDDSLLPANYVYRVGHLWQRAEPDSLIAWGYKPRARRSCAASWICQMSQPDRSSSLRIDDFAFRRGYRFGTILVNLESHRVVDLLPDRQAETAAQWMRQQPDLAVVSRDRGGEYASAAREGAPQAIQCADRFHIVKNLTEAVQVLLARCQAEILAEKKPDESCQDEQKKPLISIEEWRPPEPARAREGALSSACRPICAVSTSCRTR